MDLNHVYGGDLSVSPSGDLALAGPAQTTQQRLYRRLLTNPAMTNDGGDVDSTGDYLAHQDYGAGLGRVVGSPADIPGVKAMITGQVGKEPAVARSPALKVLVSSIADGLTASVQYIDANTNATQLIAFDIKR